MFQNKPVIGICPLYDEKKESYWMLPGYMQMLEAAGALPLMMPLTGDENTLAYYLETCDGFIIPGGQDVSPAVYGCEKLDVCGCTVPERDWMDAYILKEAIRRDKAVLGICRGHQLINVALGGTLIQHMEGHEELAPGIDSVHAVHTAAGSFLHRLYGTHFHVNSSHHQALDRLGSGLEAVQWCGEIIEATAHTSLPIYTVQWHPERLYEGGRNADTVSGQRLIDWFAQQC